MDLGIDIITVSEGAKKPSRLQNFADVGLGEDDTWRETIPTYYKSVTDSFRAVPANDEAEGNDAPEAMPTSTAMAAPASVAALTKPEAESTPQPPPKYLARPNEPLKQVDLAKPHSERDSCKDKDGKNKGEGQGEEENESYSQLQSRAF